ncbi:MAG TPA: nickel pincer cofactor biosynthesis protein LarB [Thermomicrobiaceae bacterium]|nr:nickel pincer cofactor biosynthesis protein LarB [Thermomicrobiaceae bacterium]
MSEGEDRPSDRVFGDLIRSLMDDPPAEGPAPSARLDTGRVTRKGVPEVVFAPGKTTGQILDIVRTMLSTSGTVVVSRVDAPLVEQLRGEFPGASVEHRAGTWTVAVREPGRQPPRTGGRVAIITAGTSDIPAAEEARVVAEEMGCEVTLLADMGVAGLHRLFGPLRRVIDDGVHAIVVVAGMDGALPSVVAGLVPVPVIGLPTSVGYGYGGGGQAALMSMLQTCAPGLTVVNIDNAVGAGASAAMIANAVARGGVRS